MRRAARLGDGWMPMGDPTEQMPRFKEYMSEAGRDSIQLMTRLVAGDGGPDAWIADAKRLQGIGATHITIGAPQGVAGEDATKRIMEARSALASALG
jgi:alkanesulfonate monooxygenase SsuD/methylene tetrahydromethanopterin reductase-like flavin-dependent oxidoreductase (luciferase family)